MNNEDWKDIPGYEGLYQCSSLGNIKSLKSGKEKILRLCNLNGYKRVNLSKNGKNKAIYIHRIVGMTFLDNIWNKPEVNHINGIKDDNRVENLEWVTKSENITHSFRKLGRISHMKGVKGIKSVLGKKVSQYSLNGDFIRHWDSIMDIQRELGISRTCISDNCRGLQKKAGGFIWSYL